MPDKTAKAQPENKIFSHPIEVDAVPEQGLDVTISADAATRKALAEVDGLAVIDRLDADFHVARRGLAQFNVSGTVYGHITQISVVSLEPFETDIVEEVDVDFADPTTDEFAAAHAAALVGAPDAPGRDPPDPIIDGIIDLGSLAAEFLALGLDPYPRKQGEEFAPIASDQKDVPKPFDVLRKLTDSSS
jgi:hypothetical protein